MEAKIAIRIKGDYAYAVKNLAWKFISKEFKQELKEGILTIQMWIQSNKFLTKVGYDKDGKVKTKPKGANRKRRNNRNKGNQNRFRGGRRNNNQRNRRNSRPKPKSKKLF